jgi:hypothetical protein
VETLARLAHDLAPFRGVLLFAFIDPVVIAIGLWMGWNASQPAKIILAGLAAGLAGTVLGFFASLIGFGWFDGGYRFWGPHVLFRIFAGIAWALAGFAARRVMRPAHNVE